MPRAKSFAWKEFNDIPSEDSKGQCVECRHCGHPVIGQAPKLENHLHRCTDKHGRLQKCKARLVVCGNQQKHHDLPTRTTTLAITSLRVLLAVAAKFDLETLQLDAVNAFVHADLDETLFMRMPPGYGENGKVLRLNKALYGLRRSSLLWQQKLTKEMERLGFKTIPQEPCVVQKDGIIGFFYVDDSLDRKSSQGYMMKLFGGAVAWRANKQDSVTTSTTEAELLAVSQTARETIYLSRLMKALKLVLPEALTIECDNLQTIRLLVDEAMKLQTKLRHVDIESRPGEKSII